MVVKKMLMPRELRNFRALLFMPLSRREPVSEMMVST